MMALLEPGDEVIYPNPGFPIYESMINFLGAKPVPIPLVEDRGFSFDLNVLKDSLSPKTKMLILNSPHNPTGGVIPAADVRAIADMVRDRDLVILSDEIYTRIYFDEDAAVDQHAAGHAGENDYSGWLFEDLRDDGLAHGLRRDADVAGGSGEQADGEFELVHREFHAAGGNRGAERAAGRRRRKWWRSFGAGAMLSARRLNTLPGFRCPIPGGAFYAFPNIQGTGWKSKELADALLQKAGVACLSGTAFGAYGDGYLRFSIANSYEKLMDAVERIRKFLAKRDERR